MKNVILCKKKFLQWVLFLLAACFLTGCAPEEQREEKEIPVIRIGITDKAGISQDLEEINQILGKLSEEKTGIRAELVWTGLNARAVSDYYKSKRQDIDITSLYFSAFQEYREKQLLLNLEPYLKDATALKEVLSQKVPLSSGEQKGVYGIPKPLSDLHSNGVIFNRALVEKYDLDVSEVRRPEDLEPLFDVIKEKEPEITPWVLEGYRKAVIYREPVGDILDGCLSGILYETNDLQVCNIYESKAYEERLIRAQRWRKKGYLADDVLTELENGKMKVAAGDAFATECVIKPDETEYDQSIYGDDIIIQPFDTQPVLDTEDDWILVWGVLQDTGHPREAVQILNMLYEDRDVLNLILYGIEGKHYEVLEDGSFTWPQGVNEENVSYVCGSKWRYNTPKAGIWHGMSDDLEGEMQDLRRRAKVSSAYGFWFDEGRVTVDLEKMKAIVAKYTPKLETGMCDLDTELEKFRSELRAAGSEQLVQEVQSQLDEWNMSEKEHSLTD